MSDTASPPKKHVTIEVGPDYVAKEHTAVSHHHSSLEELKRDQNTTYNGDDIRAQIAKQQKVCNEQHKHDDAAAAAGSAAVCDDVFVVKADAAFYDAHQRGKKPRFDGFSMKNWYDHCKAKFQKNAQSGKGLVDKMNLEEVTLMTRLPPMTEAEVRLHNDSDDLYMVVRGIVYDCTTFQRFHPGGEAILRAVAGRDGTEVYDYYHKWVDCLGLLAAYAVGRLVKEKPSGDE